MVKQINERNILDDGIMKKLIDYRGLAADEKPVNDEIYQGSSFIEMDTGDIYLYDQENKTWIKFA